jgi:plastocyanin
MRTRIAIAAAVALTGVLGYGGPGLATTEPEIEMEDFTYRPARLVVRPGAVVIWKNRDRVRHNAASIRRRANGQRLFRTRLIGFRGEATARAPRARGTYRYLCTIHPRMRGTLVVR